MHPVLFKIFFLPVYSYGLMLALGFLLCLWLISRKAVSLCIPRVSITDFGLYVIISGIIGARLLNVFFELPYYLKHPYEIFLIQKGGLAFHGGLLLALFTGYWYLKKHKLNIREIADIVILYLPIGEAIGRIGCFLNGCCYGKPANLPWAVQFPAGSFAEIQFGPGHLIHPVQLYSSFTDIVIFIILGLLYKKFRGKLLFLYFVLSGISRFILEYFRAENKAVLFGLNIFQFISLGLIITGAVFMAGSKKNA